jgi:hypothetical protein
MEDDNDNTAYIRFEREENTLKYIAKVFNEPPREITKARYNAIVKALSNMDWARNDEDEASVISKIIGDNLETTE